MPAPRMLPAGTPAPELALPALDGSPLSLAALHGRPVLVHFFATWCEPCREELPALARLAARLDPETGPVLLTVDVGEVPVRIRRYFERSFAGSAPGFPVLIDEDRAAARAWSITTLPATVLIDPGHRVRQTADGPVDWDHPQARAALDSLSASNPLAASNPLSASTAAPDTPPLPPLTDREPSHDQPS